MKHININHYLAIIVKPYTNQEAYQFILEKSWSLLVNNKRFMVSLIDILIYWESQSFQMLQKLFATFYMFS